jgi:hypothetical protein
VPAPITSGSLRDENYVRAMQRAYGKKVVLPAGAFLVTEFLDLHTKGDRGPTPLLVGQVGESIAMMHMRSEGFSSRYGFDCDTYIGTDRVRGLPAFACMCVALVDDSAPVRTRLGCEYVWYTLCVDVWISCSPRMPPTQYFRR